MAIGKGNFGKVLFDGTGYSEHVHKCTCKECIEDDHYWATRPKKVTMSEQILDLIKDYQPSIGYDDFWDNPYGGIEFIKKLKEIVE
jgi:hypothetical protein